MVIDGLWKYIQSKITPKPLELESWNFERIVTPQHMSHVTSHMSCVTCQVSGVRCQVSHFTCNFYLFFFSFLDKLVKLVSGGSVIHGPTLSSLKKVTIKFTIFNRFRCFRWFFHYLVTNALWEKPLKKWHLEFARDYSTFLCLLLSFLIV